MAVIAIVSARSSVGRGRPAGADQRPTASTAAPSRPRFPAVDFALRDQDGTIVRLRALAASVVARDLRVLRPARHLPAGRSSSCAARSPSCRRPIPALAISVDPGQDTRRQRARVPAQAAGRRPAALPVAAARRSRRSGGRSACAPARRRSARAGRTRSRSCCSTARARARALRDVAQMDPDAIAADIRTLEPELPPEPPSASPL